MNIVVLCKDRLLADALRSIIEHDGQLGVARTYLDVRSVIEVETAEATLLVLVADGISEEEWRMLHEIKGKSGKILAVLSGATNQARAGTADLTVRGSEGSEALLRAVEALAGESDRTARARQPFDHPEARRSLTKRELDVAQLVSHGLSNRRIAQTLNLQEQSIKNIVSGILRKLECENRVQVALRLTGAASSRK